MNRQGYQPDETMLTGRFVEMMDTVLRFAVYTQQQGQLV